MSLPNQPVPVVDPNVKVPSVQNALEGRDLPMETKKLSTLTNVANLDPATVFEYLYTGDQLANIPEYQRVKAQKNQLSQARDSLVATAAPTTSSMRVLENALKMKEDAVNQPLGESDLFKKAGLSGYSVLAQSLQEKSREMDDKFRSYTNLLNEVGGTMKDTYQRTLKNYELLKTEYDQDVARINKIVDLQREYDQAINLANEQSRLRKEEADFAAKLKEKYTPTITETDEGKLQYDSETGTYIPVTDLVSDYTIQNGRVVGKTDKPRSYDLQAIATGKALPLNTLASSSIMKRTDRHNNPTANKAYSVTIQRLKSAGLVEGVDFAIGETTAGIDGDGVATILYKDPETGVLGSIATLKAGEIGSWYANSKYGGASKIINKLSQLSGKSVNSTNAQAVFNALPVDQQTQVVKEIYKHEGGKVLFQEGSSAKGEKKYAIDQLSEANKAIESGEFKTKTQREVANYIQSKFDDPETPVVELLRLTEGKKVGTQSERAKFGSYMKVANQMDTLRNSLEETDPGGYIDKIMEEIRSRNPFSEKARKIKAQITGLVPSVARGIFDEVGVLTDTDIARYEAILPTLKDTKAQQDALFDLMARMLYNGISSDLESYARGQLDVSDYAGGLDKIQSNINETFLAPTTSSVMSTLDIIIKAQGQKSLKPGEILVKDKATGQVGAIPEDEFDATIYTKY